MIKKPYPPEVIRGILILWHAYKIRLSYAPESTTNIHIDYVFKNKSAGGIIFTQYLN